MLRNKFGSNKYHVLFSVLCKQGLKSATHLLNLGFIACRALLEMVYRDNETKTNGRFGIFFYSFQVSQVYALANHSSQRFPRELGLLVGVPGVCTAGTKGCVHIWH